LIIKNLNINTAAGNKYAICCSDVSDVLVEGVTGTTVSDLIHFAGPANNITVWNIKGTTGDDCVAFTAVDYPTYAPGSGDITNITIDGVEATTGHSIVKVIGGTGAVVRGARITNIRGAANISVNLFYDPTCGPSDVDDIVIDGVAVDMSAYATGRIISAITQNGKNLTARNIVSTKGTLAGQILLDLHTWNSVVLDGVVSSELQSGSVIRVGAGGSVKTILASNIGLSSAEAIIMDITGTATNIIFDKVSLSTESTLTGRLLNFGSSAIASTVIVNNIKMYKGRSIFDIASGAAVPSIQVTNSVLNGTNRIGNTAVSTEITILNVKLGTVNPSLYVSNSAALTVLGSGVSRTNASNGLQRAGSEVIHVINQDYPSDLALLTAATGDRCLATAGALTPATLPAPAIYNGTAWKSLYNIP
jgi:hypothetical protein